MLSQFFFLSQLLILPPPMSFYDPMFLCVKKVRSTLAAGVPLPYIKLSISHTPSPPDLSKNYIICVSTLPVSPFSC